MRASALSFVVVGFAAAFLSCTEPDSTGPDASDPCQAAPCKNGGTCTSNGSNFTCACRSGYTGNDCGTIVDVPDYCSPNPCRNGATCANTGGDFACTCQPGYEGKACDVVTDNCSPNPCQNGATCNNKVNGFDCDCQPGFEGTTCETDIDDCSPNPCQNGGTCTDKVNDFSCACQPGYEGKACQVVTDNCAPNPCKNGGTCTNKVNGFECTCVAGSGFEGKVCDANSADCSPNPCQNGGACTPKSGGGFTCACAGTFSGSTCTTNGLPVGSACTAASDCAAPSTAAAVCLSEFMPLQGLIYPGTDPDLAAFYEGIGLSFPGGYCSTQVNCATDQDCGEGGTCYVAMDGVSQETIDAVAALVPFDVNAFKTVGLCMKACTQDSECRTGYVCGWPLGDLLSLIGGTKRTFCIEDTSADPCQASPCQNGGTCEKIDTTQYQCQCPAGFTGTNCEVTDNCAPNNPCQNGGMCENLGAVDYQCHCAAGFEGANCQTDIDECSPNPCQNGAACTDRVNDFTCACVPGYQGKTCDVVTDNCAPNNPCQNGATCTNGINDYSCACEPGYEGKDCNVVTNNCAPNPCQNGATCTNKVAGFTCNCEPGYEGATCAVVTNNCSPNPCQNGATCTNKVAGFTCNCQPGYEGATCAVVTNNCSPNPCQNGATCTNKVAGFTCNCQPGYQGTTCETDIDDCSPNPCKNGGTCTDKVNDFTCTCPVGFTGTICDAHPDDCLPNPCMNGGSCTPKGGGGFTCTCAGNYSGPTCELNGLPVGSACSSASDCAAPSTAASVCLTEFMPLQGLIYPGTDPDVAASFESIGLHFQGGYCSTQGDCATDADCGYGGTCYVPMAGIPQGVIDQLAPTLPFDIAAFQSTGLCMKACTQDSDCRPEYKCDWPLGDLLGLIGGTPSTFCIERDPCQAAPCQNGGTCVKIDALSYQCQCAAGYEGTNCETQTDNCASLPCQNGGTCTNQIGDYSCTCVPGYLGKNCETLIDHCETNPCQNGGACTNLVNDFSCACPTGYMGKTCDVTDYCAPNPCQNGATCTNAMGDYTCQCVGSWEGKNCELPLCYETYTDVIYRLTGNFRVVTTLGTQNVSVGNNMTSPLFADSTNSTPFVADGPFTQAFARLRFTNSSSGHPDAGAASLVEFYMPLDYTQTIGITSPIDTDHSVGLLATGLPNCDNTSAASKCTNRNPTLDRRCASNAQGSVSGTTLTWDTCTPNPTASNSSAWTYASASASTGAGCATDWTSWGRAGPCSGSMCSSAPACSRDDSYEVWKQQLKPLTFSGTDYRTASFTMPEFRVPNCTSGILATTATLMTVTSATVIATQCGSTPGIDLVCNIQ